ncbi:hypothetical protein [Prauserella muralis]|uniref:Uncharacterized protein n=1 Tax=Prauserella muralis TaxID=588067 RepID=A0A2V4ABP8_9PSEU|nr:hypothetical protein [Prauserella muralis]PXY16546.1 hypothetical protein BAY60_35690 [Prauserella muralis]
MRNHERQHLPELPAGFSTETCVVVSCRTCQDFYGDDEEGGIIHFRGLHEAAEVVATAGWWVTVQGVQSRHCAAAEACATRAVDPPTLGPADPAARQGRGEPNLARPLARAARSPRRPALARARPRRRCRAGHRGRP